MDKSMISSEYLYYTQLFIENSNEVMWFLDLTTFTFKFISPSIYDLIGYTAEEILQRNLQDFLTPLTSQLFLSLLPKRIAAFEAGDNSVKTETHELEQTCRNGSVIPVEVVTTLIPENGKVTGIIGIIRNINERKKNIRELKQNANEYIVLNERMKLATKAANIGIWDWNIIENKLIWDDGMFKLYDVKREEFSGTFEFWLSCIHPDDREKCLGDAQDSLNGKREYDSLFRIVWSDGSIHFIKALAQVIRSDDGKPLRVIGINYDITEQRLTENALKQSELVADERQEHFRLAFVTNPDPISISRFEDGKFIMVNEGFCQATGYRLTEVIGATSQELKLWNNFADRDLLLENLRKEGVIKNMEVKLRHKNGGIHTALLSASLMNINNEEHLLVIAHDIEDIVKAEEELKKAKERAQENDRLKTIFLQNMSHEIRTPMNAIMGFANLIPTYIDDKEKVLDFSQIINQRGSDLLDIINDLLEFSKIESGQLPVHLETCKISEIFSELKDFFTNYKKRIDKDNIDFDINFPCVGQEFIIITDRVKLTQIFINLIYNAFKFTTKGKIEVGYNLDGTGVMEFYVSDTGMGIPDDKQATIFERFKQLDDTMNTQGGFGLGLAIVKGLVELLGGNIRIESKLGVGSKFIFKIQYVIVNEKTEKTATSTETNLSGLDSCSILVVEDEEYSRLYIKEICSAKGLNLYYVDSGKKAIEFVDANRVDLILMDIRLPEMLGYEATRIIKAKYPYIKIIAQTAYASANDRQKALESGCDDYISKPVNRNLLFSKISMLLEKVS